VRIGYLPRFAGSAEPQNALLQQHQDYRSPFPYGLREYSHGPCRVYCFDGMVRLLRRGVMLGLVKR
jgi:hypothetical protein